MGKLVLLYFGTIILAYLSQVYYPVRADGIPGEPHFMRDKTDIFCVAVIIWMTLFNGLKTSYNDTGNYIMIFNSSATTIGEHYATSQDLGLADNPLYYIAQLLCKKVIDNYHVWFLITAFFNSYVVVKFFKRYSNSLPFCILIYHAVGTYVMYIAAIKQSIAIAILLIALPYLLQHKWVHYYLLVALAILFHTHAFLFLFVPLFLGKPWNKITYISIFVCISAMLTYDVTLGTFMEYAQSVGANVAEIEVFDGHSINVLRVLVYSVVPLLSFIFGNRLFNNSSTAENVIVNMSILSFLILSIGLIEGANLYARMAGYFEIATCIALPWIIKKVFDEKSCKFIFLCIALFYSIYFIYEFTISKDFSGGYKAISLFEFLKTLIPS